MAITVSYIGARGDHLPLGGTNDTALNVNQLDPKYMALGARLSDTLPNPFFGNAAAGPLSTQATLTRAQLLRPYPQFLNISARQVSEGMNRYNAGVIEWSRRTGGSNWFGGRVSYTYSVLKDNQFGESNFFTNSGPALPLNAYNYIEGSPYYNPRAEYGYGILDLPHRFVMSPIVEVPFGDGRRWSSSNGLIDLLAGGWTAAAVVTIQSGFPIGVQQSDNTGTFGGAQRPNLVDGARHEHPRRSVRPARLGGSLHRGVAESRGVHDRGGVHVWQCAAHHHRRAHTAAAQRRPVGLQEHQTRRDALRAGAGRGHQSSQPRHDEQHRDHGRELDLRPDLVAIGIHAADAVLVPLFVLTP